MSVINVPSPPLRSQGKSQDEYSTEFEAFASALPQFASDLNTIGSAYALSTTGTSTTSVLIGTGSKSFTTQTGLGYLVGMTLRIANSSTNFMTGEVTSYNSGTGALVMNITSVSGSGTLASWTITMAAVGDLSSKANLSGATFTGDVSVPDDAYDATAWNGNLEVPTKNAVRDKIEALSIPPMPRRASSSTETLVAADMSKVVVTSTASTLTLPLLSAVLDGQMIGFMLNGAAVVTVQRQSTDELSWNQVTGLNSLKLTQYGDYLILWADKTSSRWRVFAENIQGPAFSATYSGAGQTLGGVNTRTKLQFNSETTDTHANYDPTTDYRFTPSIPGWYLIEAQAFISGGVQTRVELIIYKNGVYATSTCGLKSGTADGNFAMTGLIYCNGTTDYVEVWANGIDANVSFNNTRPSRFVGIRIR